MRVQKKDLGFESNHELIIEYDDDEGNFYYIMLGGWPGPVTVMEDETDEFTFTGSVVVNSPGDGGTKNTRLIRCPGQTVTVALER